LLALTLCAVVVRFKAVGNAPIMKQNFFKVTVSNRFQAVIQFLRKELGWKQGEPLVRVVVLFLDSRD
jgi:ubiquitin-like protein ATG12